MKAPLHLYGPYFSRRQRITLRILHVLRTLAIATSVVVAMPLVAGIAYGTYLLATGS